MCVGKRKENRGCDKVPLSVFAFHTWHLKKEEKQACFGEKKEEVNFGDTLWSLGHSSGEVLVMCVREGLTESIAAFLFCLHWMRINSVCLKYYKEIKKNKGKD